MTGKWVRIPCPNCGRQGTAAVNKDLGWLRCYHDECDTNEPFPVYSARTIAVRSDPSWWSVLRFRAQITQAVWNVSAKWGYWFRREDARERAEDLVRGYAGDERGPNDMGSLDDWEAQVNGDQDELDRIVLGTLNRDLSNSAQSAKRAREREKAAEIAFTTGIPKQTALRIVRDEYVKGPWQDQLEGYGKRVTESAPSAEDVAIANMSLEEMQDKCPIHHLRYVVGLKPGEIARKYSVKVDTVRDWMEREREKVAGDQRIAA